jgi:membrane associated rhomboid family serine protease
VFERKYALNALSMTLIYLFVCWFIYFMQVSDLLDLRPNGVRPRELRGLLGVGLSPFLHANFDHLMNNTLSFAVLNTYFFYF